MEMVIETKYVGQVGREESLVATCPIQLLDSSIVQDYSDNDGMQS